LSGRRRIYSPFFCNVHHIPPAYCYRCPFNHTYPGCGVLCAKALETELRQLGPENVAVFIAEPIVGSALGCAPPPAEYFSIIRQICDQYDVVFVADEVMTGFGRLGRWFGIENWSVVPDIIACAKGISGGYIPLGAIIVDEEIVELMIAKESNIITGHTNSAHHVTAAAGVAVINYIRTHDLLKQGREIGSYFEEGMQSLAELPLVGDVRGKGLFMGIELVRDKRTKEPFDPQVRIAHRVEKAALERGLITYPGTGCVDGDRGDHLLMAPPLTISRTEIDELVSILGAAIGEVAEKMI
jgi:adenosylmethionine-8-amino-7-oxononanoate aminotransferase